MKKILAVLALVATGNVCADEISFGDLNFFPKQTQFIFSADAALSHYQRIQGNGTVDNQFETEGYETDLSLTYAVMDNLNVFLTLGYDYRMKLTNDTAGGSSAHQDGLENPGVGINYRLMNQKDAGFNFDLRALANIKFEDEETGAAGGVGEDGNASTGRNSLDVGARLGKKWNEANEWQVGGGLIYHMDGQRDQMNVGASSTDYDVDSSSDFYAKANYQYRPVYEFMLNVGVQSMMIGEVKEDTSAINHKYKSHIDSDFTFQAKYLILANLIARFNYLQGMSPDYDVDSNTGDFEIRRRRRQIMGIGLDYLF